MKIPNWRWLKTLLLLPVFLSSLLVLFVLAYLFISAMVGPTPLTIKYDDLKPVMDAMQKLRSAVEVPQEEKELWSNLQKKLATTREDMEATFLTIEYLSEIRGLLVKLSKHAEKNRTEYLKKLKQIHEAQQNLFAKDLSSENTALKKDALDSLLVKISEFTDSARKVMVLDEKLSLDLSVVIRRIDAAFLIRETPESSDPAIELNAPNLQEIERIILQLSAKRAVRSATIWDALYETEASFQTVSKKVFAPWAFQGYKQEEGKIQDDHPRRGMEFMRKLNLMLAELWPWPFIAAVIILLLVLTGAGRDWTAKFLGRIRELHLKDILTIILDPATKSKIEKDAKVYMEINKEILKEQYEKEVVKFDIINKFGLVYKNNITPWFATNVVKGLPQDIRCTIHVPYALVGRSLYQLIHYWPEEIGGGKGRILSERFGIIGMAFRLKSPVVSNKIPTDPKILVKEWGMRLDEAQMKQERQSMSAIPLKNDAEAVIGVVYLDARKDNAFVLKNKNRNFGEMFEEEISNAFKETGLLEAIDGLVKAFRLQTPQIMLYG